MKKKPAIRNTKKPAKKVAQPLVVGPWMQNSNGDYMRKDPRGRIIAFCPSRDRNWFFEWEVNINASANDESAYGFSKREDHARKHADAMLKAYGYKLLDEQPKAVKAKKKAVAKPKTKPRAKK